MLVQSPPPEPENRSKYVTVILRSSAPQHVTEALLQAGRPGSTAPWPLAALRADRPLRSGWALSQRLSPAARRVLETQYPESPRVLLERMLVVEFAPGNDTSRVIESLRNDPLVLGANDVEPSSAPKTGGSETPEPSGFVSQYHLDNHGFPAAWALQPGHATVAVVDSGLDVGHPEFQPFWLNSNGKHEWRGGNWIAVESFDTSYLTQSFAGTVYSNVDEANFNQPQNVCNATSPLLLGHGTHIAGIIGASHHPSTSPVVGGCTHCALHVIKGAATTCLTATVPPAISFAFAGGQWPGLVYAVDGGAQLVNLSFNSLPTGLSGPYQQTCANPRIFSNGTSSSNPNASSLQCLALLYAETFDVAIIGSAGNYSDWITMPAMDPRVVSVGSLDPQNAPFVHTDTGSSFYDKEWEITQFGDLSRYERKQEVVASGVQVISTFYRGANQRLDDPTNVVNCGDAAATQNGDGIGSCTGTSMSAPIVVSILALMRSTAPHIEIGSAENPGNRFGLRKALAQSTNAQGLFANRDLLQLPLPSPCPPAPRLCFANRTGFGQPNAERAVKRVLGCVNGTQVKNRVTGMWGVIKQLVEIGPDRTYVATYQQEYAMSLKPQPYVGLSLFGPPLQILHIFTTPNYPVLGSSVQDTLTPIFSVSRPKSNGEDYTLAAGIDDLEKMIDEGYRYRGRIGYILPSNQGNFNFLNVKALYRRCDAAPGVLNRDCTAFASPDEAWLPNHTHAAYKSAPTLLGYVVDGQDSDSDKIPDGFEYMIGTNPFAADTDGDLVSDGLEIGYDSWIGASQLPVSDPRGPGTGGCY